MDEMDGTLGTRRVEHLETVLEKFPVPVLIRIIALTPGRSPEVQC